MGLCFSAESEPERDSHKGENDINKSRSKVSSATESSALQTNGEILQSPNLETFCFNELTEATNNFSPNQVIGKGDFGSVFKAWIDKHSLKAAFPETGMPIAVKMLNQKGCQGQQEWLAEIKYLGRLYHPNLVKLIGYCLKDDYRLLVYEFMPNGSLENHLFRDSHFQVPSWNLLINVALGAAKGLSFLHYEADVIYRDFKTSNILLDVNYNAKLSDFGLARDGPPGNKSHVSTRVLGTEGYAAPEYIRTGHLSAKSDVYSFGIVLLEMISGRRAVERDKPSEEQDLGTWARSFNFRKFSQVLNPAISGQYPISNVIKVAQLALQCVFLDPKSRPNMKDVVRILEEVQDFNDNEGSKCCKHSKSRNGSKYGREKC